MIELFDWFVNDRCVRGSRAGDKGNWISNSAKPVYFNKTTRIIELEDGMRYLINDHTISKALGLNVLSNKILASLQNKP